LQLRDPSDNISFSKLLPQNDHSFSVYNILFFESIKLESERHDRNGVDNDLVDIHSVKHSFLFKWKEQQIAYYKDFSKTRARKMLEKYSSGITNWIPHSWYWERENLVRESIDLKIHEIEWASIWLRKLLKEYF